MSLKKKFGFISAFLTAAALTVCNTAHAIDNEIKILSKVTQYDDICGSVNINILTDTNIYVKITKHTPETDEDGYVVYDTVIKASDVYDDCKSVMKLESINYNIESQEYDGYYDILIGVHKHIGSEDPEDILYKNIYFIVTDKDVSGYDTVCDINVSLSAEDMEEPEMKELSEGSDKKFDIIFPHIEMPSEPEPKPEIIWGDANSDGNINIRDAALIASKLATGKSDELPEAADYNKDGSVNIRDAAALASYLSKKQ